MISIKRTAKVLKLLADHPRRFTDLTRELQITKSTSHRLLKALEEVGMIRKDANSRRYQLGPLISHLITYPVHEHDLLINCSIQEMKRLRDLSGETVTLQIAIGSERMCLEEIQSKEAIKFVSGKGVIYPIYPGSVGKVLFSMMPNEKIKFVMKEVSRAGGLYR